MNLCTIYIKMEETHDVSNATSLQAKRYAFFGNAWTFLPCTRARIFHKSLFPFKTYFHQLNHAFIYIYGIAYSSTVMQGKLLGFCHYSKKNVFKLICTNERSPFSFSKIFRSNKRTLILMKCISDKKETMHCQCKIYLTYFKFTGMHTHDFHLKWK